jgi:hypothetical protein
VQLNPDTSKSISNENLDLNKSELIFRDDSVAKFKVPKDNVGLAVTEIVKKFDVTDVKIDAEDIETIIESLIKR